jgi:hypothetical protein
MTDTDRTSNARVRRLVGVYDADGSWRGELAYWIGARLGRRHCSLCDITHGSVRERPEWAACKSEMPVEFVTFHRDDQPDEVRAAACGRVPVVVADTDRGLVLLLDPGQLDACDGSIERLISAIETAVTEAGLAWPAQEPTS